MYPTKIGPYIKLLQQFQPHDFYAKFHDVRRKPTEPTHDQQYVIAVRWRRNGPDGHDRGHDCGPESRRLSSATGQWLLVRGRSSSELRASSSWIRSKAHLQPHPALPYGGPEPVQSEHQLDRWVSTALTALAACTLADGLPRITRYRACR